MAKLQKYQRYLWVLCINHSLTKIQDQGKMKKYVMVREFSAQGNACRGRVCYFYISPKEIPLETIKNVYSFT